MTTIRIGAISALALLAASSCGRPVPRDLLSPRPDTGASAVAVPGVDPTLVLPEGRDVLPGTWHDISFIGDWNMDTNTVRMLGAIWQGMGDAFEIIGAASRIRPGSEVSWYESWSSLGARVAEMGDQSLAAGHRQSAGQAYLRAANYFRAAEFYLHANPADPRILDAYRKLRQYFLAGMQLTGSTCVEVRIPYQDTTLRGYYFHAPGLVGRGPTLIAVPGFDGALEESKWVADQANLRGYNCLLLEGPGQGLVIREQGITAIPEWERPVGAAVDWLLERDDVDPDRIGLYGSSFGGGYVVRAAQFEPRLAAVIANPGYTDLGEVLVLEQLGQKFLNLYRDDPVEFSKMASQITGYGVAARWFFADGMWKFGVSSAAELLDKLRTLAYGADVERIRCRFLIMDGESEIAGKGQSRALYDALQGPKTYTFFQDSDFSSWHCQNGATAQSAQRLFDWLEENL